MDMAALAVEYRTLRPLASGSVYLLNRTVALFSEYLGRSAEVSDLEDLMVSRWLVWLSDRQTAWTVAGHRTRILALWRLAARRHGIAGPGEVRSVKKPPPMPRAWSLDQLKTILDASRHLNGRASAYFHALILAAWESGLRAKDLESLPRVAISPDGTVVRQRKTGQPQVFCFRPETAAEILALPGDCPLRSPWSTGRTREYWLRLRIWAGLSSGALHQIRRSGASWVAAQQGIDAARQYLGHRSSEMWRHYVDPAIAGPRPCLPPPLD